MGVKLDLILREEQNLRVFEKRVLTRKFVPKREEITGRRGNYIILPRLSFLARLSLEFSHPKFV
jgi:hypothetical protein